MVKAPLYNFRICTHNKNTQVSIKQLFWNKEETFVESKSEPIFIADTVDELINIVEVMLADLKRNKTKWVKFK